MFIATPSVNELPILPDSQSIEAELIRNVDDAQGLGMEVLHLEQYEARETRRFEFIETRIELTPEGLGNGTRQRFSIWMPNRPIEGNDFIMISRPGILTPEGIGLAFELMRSM